MTALSECLHETEHLDHVEENLKKTHVNFKKRFERSDWPTHHVVCYEFKVQLRIWPFILSARFGYRGVQSGVPVSKYGCFTIEVRVPFGQN